jgi:hypothetical protein
MFESLSVSGLQAWLTGLPDGRTSGSPPCYLRFGARCDRALPAAVFDAFDVRPSRSTLEADLAAFGEVLRLLAMRVSPLSFPGSPRLVS